LRTLDAIQFLEWLAEEPMISRYPEYA